jgi:uncharacterized alkaline shock family protein YloU
MNYIICILHIKGDWNTIVIIISRQLLYRRGGHIKMAVKKVNSLGEIVISEEVIATLAGISAIECYGIVGMASKRATDGLVELLGYDNLSKGVKVYTQDNGVIINLYIIVEYGISIAAVGKNVIETVKYNVENITGIIVKKVDITVEGIRV